MPFPMLEIGPTQEEKDRGKLRPHHQGGSEGQGWLAFFYWTLAGRTGTHPRSSALIWWGRYMDQDHPKFDLAVFGYSL